MNTTKNQLYIGLDGNHNAVEILRAVSPFNPGFRTTTGVSLLRGR